MNFKSILSFCVIGCASLLCAAGTPTVAGSGDGANSPYATDAYPGFDEPAANKRPERREKSWFLSVDFPTSAEQWTWAQELQNEGEYKDAAKACDALVREWPSSKEAPQAQLAYTKLLATYLEDYEEAFEQLEYLFDFYAQDCDYLSLVKWGYQLVNTMVDKKKTFLGFSFLANSTVRRAYESLVRRSPSADFVPEALLKIAALREDDQHYEEASEVYAQLQLKYPFCAEVQQAAYREAKARMWLCRRLAYNAVRCEDSRLFLAQLLTRFPNLPERAEVEKWQKELTDYQAEAAYQKARFYDTKQRTRHATIAAWQRYLKEYPTSPRAESVRARLQELSQPNVLSKEK